MKKVIRKLNKKIYYFYRRIRVADNSSMLEDSFFYNFSSNCNFLYNVKKIKWYCVNLEEMDLFNSIITSADNICNHKFNLLGSEQKYLGGSLPWNEDFKTGYNWKSKFYKNIKIVNLLNNADVKVPWELSRFQHIFTIGKAYWITNDEKYALEFKEEVEDWIEKNLVEMSVNWTCTMDVAIRAVNLICGYFFFEKSSSIDSEFWVQFNKLLYLHGRFIFKNLENEGQHNGNHYLSDLTGLIWLGIYFDDFAVDDKEKKNNPKDWLQLGLKEFENEIKNEVNEDGTDYEASTSYHRLVTELFLTTTILCDKNNIHFTKEYKEKLDKMCEFIMNITKPNGLSPVIGDADDGRLLIVSNYENWEKRNFAHILAVAGEYFDRDDFRYIGRDFKEDALWIIENFKKSEVMPKLSSKAYHKGGYYILRDDRIYCLIRCGELSCRGEGEHSHNDQLSIELNVNGEDFIVDPGTYVYTSDYNMRNLFRSTKMHNTLQIGNCEQNDFDKYDLFYMKEQTFAKCLKFNQTTFLGEHYGYKEKFNLVHQRMINLYEDELNVEDKLIGNEISGKIYINFILDYGVETVEHQNGIELIKNNKKIFIKFKNSYNIIDTYLSYNYGQKLKTKKISIQLEECHSEIKFICC
ncbi:alginate lyase family protein [Clostridium coskatii]|nr:alginate lyase family protein [Clostridium coskatii]